MKSLCLTQEELLLLYYQEGELKKYKKHLQTCSECQQKFYNLCSDLIDVEFCVPDGGHEAVADAVKELFEAEEKSVSADDEILTPEEAAKWLKVSVHNIYNILHLVPHFVIDGHVRFERQKMFEYVKGRSRDTEKAPDQSHKNIIPFISRKAM
jgi:hypothetical protein